LNAAITVPSRRAVRKPPFIVRALAGLCDRGSVARNVTDWFDRYLGAAR
jgi:hypothetical protein